MRFSSSQADTRARVADVFHRIFGPDRGARYDRTDGWYSRYCGHLANPESASRYVQAVCHLLERDGRDLRRMRVLDLGCGFGMTCLAVSLLGARSVFGVDLARGMLSTFAAVLRDLVVPPRVFPVASESRALACADGSFDLVLIVEALSHFLDPKLTLREAFRVLKPGGLLVIADDNNGANPRTIAANSEVWERFENGPPTEDVHGHRVQVPYRERRENIIRDAFPQLRPEDVELLGARTAFMTKAQILAACRGYLAGGPPPDSRYMPGQCPVEPETGQYIENPLNPFDLVSELAGNGFQVKLEAYFGGESRGGVVRLANRLLNFALPLSLTLRHSGGFRIWATKTSEESDMRGSIPS